MNKTNQLLRLLSRDTVRLSQRVEDWRQVITLAGQLLLEQGAIDDSYIEECIQAKQEMGAYFVIRPGVAISHARPGKNVKRVCISLVTLDPPVFFGHPDNDPVSLLFLFGTQDNQAHLDLLKDLSKLLCDDALVEQVIQAKSFDSLYEGISRALQ